MTHGHEVDQGNLRASGVGNIAASVALLFGPIITIPLVLVWTFVLSDRPLDLLVVAPIFWAGAVVVGAVLCLVVGWPATVLLVTLRQTSWIAFAMAGFAGGAVGLVAFIWVMPGRLTELTADMFLIFGTFGAANALMFRWRLSKQSTAGQRSSDGDDLRSCGRRAK